MSSSFISSVLIYNANKVDRWIWTDLHDRRHCVEVEHLRVLAEPKNNTNVAILNNTGDEIKACT